jgi:phosphatidylglycerol---prolipoprotein diacylglyceryl transferase
VHPELIRIGSFALPSYGLMMALGFLAALWLVRRRSPAFGVAPDVASDIGIWVLLSGLLGSKLLLVIVDWPQYVSSWSGLKDLARAGGVFYGGLMGAVVATAVLLRKREIPFFTFADIAAPAAALGQGLGRVGCLLAGCCWGRNCTLPWAVTFTDENAHDNVGVPLNLPLHPTQIYEALGTLALCILLIVLERRRYSGQTFVRYLFGYAFLRFTIELFRGDPRGSVLGLMSTSQFIALCGVAVAGALWALRRKTAPAPAAA